MEFTTQAELLEHLGKNPNDRSLVQRMIARWEVVKEWWMYVIVDKDVIIRELMERIKELEKSEQEKEVAVNSWSVAELEEAKIQWEYWEKRCKRYYDYLEQVISITYNRIKPILWNKLESESDFRKHIMSEVKENKD